MKRLLMVFIDGLGLGDANALSNPIRREGYPFLSKILYEDSFPIDPVMGVPGIPQSATGQTNLLCGVNSQSLLGAHKEGFPGKTLKKIIENENIFKKLKAMNKTGTFANGYWRTDLSELKKMISVTTAASLCGTGGVRLMQKLIEGDAVYQDLTQEILAAKGAALPVIRVEEAAERLTRISEKHDFTLFEYFQTDIAGHRQDGERIRKVLADLDGFLSRLHRLFDFDRNALIIVSDHGNIEDCSTPGHTCNPVPFYARGRGSGLFRERVKDLAGVTPAVLEWFGSPE